jgi:hypothetical protein
MRFKHWKTRGLALLLSGALTLGMMSTAMATDGAPLDSGLLTEPFLQVPGQTSVNVVWFTEGDQAPASNKVLLYENGEDHAATREVEAETTQLSRIRGGKTSSDCNDPAIERNIWRHEAVVDGLPEYHGKEEEQIPYRVVSDTAQSEIYTLQAQAQAGTPMKILLTSDIQTKNMCAANIQKVYETVGQIDAILANGDIVDVADRAYDWFDADSSFFKVLQGTTDRQISGTQYSGAPLMQNAPTYAAVGNHEVMGRYSESSPLNAQFNDPTTRAYAEKLYAQLNSDDDLNNDISDEQKEQFIQDNSFNTTSWEEVFTLPESDTGDERYYAVTIGDMRVIVLEVARIWRSNSVGSKSKYSEVPGADESEYGFGQHIFEPIGEGSDQLSFLEQELQSDEFQNAKYKMVMYHWQFHSLGGNQIPAYTDPVASTVVDPVISQEMTIYDYPLAEDYLANYVEPLLEEYDVDMVFNAHSHLWNRFKTDSGMNILETSNNGNTYNAFLDTKSRTDAWPSVFNGGTRATLSSSWDQDNYVLQGDPYGLSPIAPNIAPLPNSTEDEPYLMSNTVTAFSVFDTETGMVDSYYFDTSDPDSQVVHFDSFPLQKDASYDLEENDVLSHLGGYSTGYSDQEGGVAEIVAYNADNEKAYLVNGKEKKLDIVTMSNLSASGAGQTVSLEKRVDVSGMIPGFTFGDLTSVAVDTVNNRIAVAVQAEDYTSDGAILILNYDGSYVSHYVAGVQPDMVTFTADGRYVLTANEGEPREGYGKDVVDPKGSVTIVDLSVPQPTPNTVTFDSWDDKRADLIAANVLLKSGLSPSTDFEPEYIAVSSDGKTAYVALQEANAIATLDLVSGQFTAVDSLGFKDHRVDGNELDAVKDKAIQIKWENLMGVYMPDGISLYEVGGKTYLLTANEGDASEWGDGDTEYSNMTTVEIGGENVEVLDKAKLEGLPTVPASVNFILGGRSFSIFEVTDGGLKQVFDSGSDFEQITAAAYPKYFNASNKNNKLDSRSDAKGPEPESVTICKVGGKTYAYIGLERIGGVMLYDITDPAAPFFCDYINSRDFTVDFPDAGTDPAQGDVSVEGLCAVPAASSPTGYPLLLAANEVSGTLAVYQQKEGYVDPHPGSGSSSGSTTYSVSTEACSNGSVSVSPKRAGLGDTVTITVQPYSGYQLEALTATDALGNPLPLADKGDGKYTFQMPGAKVSVKASFTPEQEIPSQSPFSDVSTGAYYYDAVVWAVEQGITLGTGATTFSPDATVTRDQAVTFLWRAAGSPAPKGGALPFTDVPSGAYYYDAVAWAVEQGITLGTSATTFSPDATVTRDQTVTLLYRTAGSPAPTDGTLPFTDVPSGAYCYDAVVWAVKQGITSGTGPSTFSPAAHCTRGQMVTFLYRSLAD